MSIEEQLKKTVVFDNPNYWDRYTVFTLDGYVYGMSNNALMPNGFNMVIGTGDEVTQGDYLGKRLDEVPETIRQAVRIRLLE